MVDLDRLAQATVYDIAGDTKMLGQVWATRPAVLVFLRHFG